MRLVVRSLDLEAGVKHIVVLSNEDARRLGVISSDRVRVKSKRIKLIAIVNISREFAPGEIGLFKEVRTKLDVSTGNTVNVERAEAPESLGFIREKIRGERLTPRKLESIVNDVVERHLNDVELASFVTALQINGTSMEEVEHLSRAMIRTGKKISFGAGPILDKHSIGGVPGDKTTLLVVPIVAAAGFTIPKSSSRAITSPAGTADRMEVLAPVEFSVSEIEKIVKDSGGCIVWGGALDLAPADDLFIQVEYPLSIDPLLLPSIISKKKAMGSTHIVVDIPMGRGAKIKSLAEAQKLSSDFIEIGNRLRMRIECAITEGEQPVGCAIGPALEAREALQALKGSGPASLVDKATSLAGMLFEMMGDTNGKEKAISILRSGKALSKMREIIKSQGGNPAIEPEKIEVGHEVSEIRADKKGMFLAVDIIKIAQIARAAGAPGDKGSGLILEKRIGDPVTKGEVLMRIFSENQSKLNYATELLREEPPFGIGSRVGEPMLIAKIMKQQKAEPAFIFER